MSPVAQRLHLPQELWMEIFTYLSPTEKANVRATFNYFKTLIDHPVLWKKSTIVLGNITPLNDDFWELLRNRKIHAIEVKKMKMKQWKKLTTSLPGLLNLTIDSCLTQEILTFLHPLTKLQKLHLKDCSGLLDRHILMEVVHYNQLTHLSLCNIKCFVGVPLTAVACLKNLFFLSLHAKYGFLNAVGVQSALFHLPKLRELSITVHLKNTQRLSECFILPEAVGSREGELSCLPKLQLQKLELIYFDHSGLTENALGQLSSLQTISLHNYKNDNMEFLNLMLKKLPNLTEVNLVGFSSLDLCCIPPRLEKFCAIRTRINNETLHQLFLCARNLKHLDLSFSYGFDVFCLTKLPVRCPRLAKLYLRGLNFPEETLIVLASMKSLRELDISNNKLLTPEAIFKFQSMTSNRTHQIVHRLQLESLCCC
ncbi:uncharacterized protein LOC115478141 [Microcaecilia unicolor]|uniref:Uncharacterized protein LOC115478141 n=1 Tax=Microcaecilia unicolor TaxID=1415580 RepID=A0A6P7YVT9_9AMPH|nr:uncharacterized protein LOC115478141 [Microcaecilia unicolor]